MARAAASAAERPQTAQQESLLSAEGSRSAISGSQERWRGVSLGGWLLLEPGPAKALFNRYRNDDGREATCEWELVENLRRENALDALVQHRESYMSLRDFQKIRGMGLNAVRVPFGYWVVLGSLRASPGRKREDPYLGPGLEYLDRAVAWAEEAGLQVLLDLHACPGGESSEAPCGRRQRPLGKWHWRHWRFEETLEALRVVAERYRDSKAVTGIAVCNEPAPEVPLSVLCRFYDRAVGLVRDTGMGPRVAVVLPVFQRSVDEFVGAWWSRTSGRHENVCFEVHWYHCFENEWHGRTFAQHLRAVEEHAQELQRYPMVVGEWSLALGRGAQPGRVSREEMCALFGRAQLAAYGQASHGWFFWNWCDANGTEWDWQQSHKAGYLPIGFDAALQQPGLPPPAAARGTYKEDPLEQVLDAPPADPRVRLGDTVYLRAFNGRYVDVDSKEGSHVRARYGDRGKWQQFTLCPVSDHAITPVRTDSSGLRDGDRVSLLAHTGRYLGLVDGAVMAEWTSVEEPCAFILRTDGAADVRHRTVVFLQSPVTGNVLAPNESDSQNQDAVVARWQHLGHWQRFVIEKPLCTAVTPHRPRRRSSFPGGLPAREGSPHSQRRSGAGAEQKPSVVQRCANGLELLAQILLTPSRRRSVGTAEEPRPQTAVTPRQLKPHGSGCGLQRRASVGGSEDCAPSATPRQRRASIGGSEDVGAPQQAVTRRGLQRRASIGGAEDISALPQAVTPRRRRSSVGAGLADPWAASMPQAATTPRRRRSSVGAGAAEAWGGSLPQATTTPRRRRSNAGAEAAEAWLAQVTLTPVQNQIGSSATEPSAAKVRTLLGALTAAAGDAATPAAAKPVDADAMDVKEDPAMPADADTADAEGPPAVLASAGAMDSKMGASPTRKRRSSVGPDDLRGVATPTRRRRLSGARAGAASPAAMVASP